MWHASLQFLNLRPFPRSPGSRTRQESSHDRAASFFRFVRVGQRGLIASMLLLPMAGWVVAQEQPLVFTGATVLTMNGQTWAPGSLIVHRGRIVSVQPAGAPAPPGASVRDVAGRVIMPGLVDTHSHIGAADLADLAGPIQPELRVLDSINVRHPSLRRAVAGGITTVNVMPGSGLLMGGQTLYLKLRNGDSIEDLLLTNSAGGVLGGLKMANGTNPQRDAPFPGTRGKAAALVRERFVAAQEYRDKMERAGGDPEKSPARDIALETLLEVLQGERIVHHHTHRHDDIQTVLRLQQEFGFRVVLHHVTDGWKIPGIIAAAGIPCSIINVDSPGGKLEARHLDWKTGGVLERAGVLTAIHTDDYITDSRLFLRSAALSVRGGMSREGALRAVTQNGALMLDLGDRVGSLEAGKDADFVILSGDPFSVYTQVLETWVEGHQVFDRNRPEDRLHAVGGLGAGQPRAAHLCCFETVEAHQ
jgi:imidazolonepropionase-like amidohydrolase